MVRVSRRQKSEAPTTAAGSYIRFVDAAGSEQVVSTAELDLMTVMSGRPVRQSPNYPGQKNITGYVYSGITQGILWRESNLEAICVLAAEYSGRFIGLVSQPFDYRYNDGSRSWHVPDFLGLTADGSFIAIDVKEVGAFTPEVRASMDRFAGAVGAIGIGHEMWHEPSHVRWHNLRRLSRVRVPGVVHELTARTAIALWSDGDTYGDLEKKMNKAGSASIFIRYAIDWAIWTRRFEVNLDERLDSRTVLQASEDDRA